MDKEKEKCAVLLVRVSTLGQDFDPQTDDLRAYAESLGYNQFHIIATKESGLVSHDNRHGSNELCQFIDDNPEYTAVFCTEMSRLGRKQSSLSALKEYFEHKKIKFFLRDSNYRYSREDPASEFLFMLYGYFAESEMKAKQDRFSRARKYYAANGYVVSGKRLFGYERVGEVGERKKYREHSTEADIVRTIFNWYLHGIDVTTKNPSIKQITLECIRRGYPEYTHSKRNVNKLLKEAAYTGYKITNNKRKLPEHSVTPENKGYAISSMEIRYPKIISDDVFNAVQEKLKSKNLNADKSRKHITILSKTIVCPECNKYYEGQYRSIGVGDKSFYRCSGAKYVFPCKNKQTISMPLLDNAVWSLIKLDLPMLAQEIEKTNPDKILAELELEKNELEKRKLLLQKNALMEKKKMDIQQRYKNTGLADLDSFEKIISRISKEIDQIEQRLIKIQELLTLHRNQLPVSVEDFVSKNIDKIQSNKEMVRQYVRIFVNEIYLVYHDRDISIVRIHFNQFTPPFKIITQTPRQHISRIEKILDKYTFLFIDKRNTRDIRLLKSTFFFEVKGNKRNIVEFGTPQNEEMSFPRRRGKIGIKKIFDLDMRNGFSVDDDPKLFRVFYSVPLSKLDFSLTH